MDPTDQEDIETPEDITPSEDVTQPEGDTPQDKEALIGEVTKQRAKKREAQEKAAQLEAELAEAREKLAAAEKATAKPDAEEPDIKALMSDIAELKGERKRGQIQAELGLSGKQADAIVALMDRTGLNAQQCLAVAKSDDPELFSASDAAPHPAVAGSLRPTRGAEPQEPKDDLDRRKELITELSTKDQLAADRLRNNLIGSRAAAALGLPHHRIPIE